LQQPSRASRRVRSDQAQWRSSGSREDAERHPVRRLAGEPQSIGDGPLTCIFGLGVLADMLCLLIVGGVSRPR
jgi:hypothetical protein